jgi:hypothetical protein
MQFRNCDRHVFDLETLKHKASLRFKRSYQPWEAGVKYFCQAQTLAYFATVSSKKKSILTLTSGDYKFSETISACLWTANVIGLMIIVTLVTLS